MQECFSLSVLWNCTLFLHFLKDTFFKSTDVFSGRVCPLVSHTETLWSAPIVGVAINADTHMLNLNCKSLVHGTCNCAWTHTATVQPCLWPGKVTVVKPYCLLVSQIDAKFVGFSLEDFLGGECLSCPANRYSLGTAYAHFTFLSSIFSHVEAQFLGSASCLACRCGKWRVTHLWR